MSRNSYLYERVSDDGERTSRRRGCAKCITRVYNTNTRRPRLAVVRAGTLDRSNGPFEAGTELRAFFALPWDCAIGSS